METSACIKLINCIKIPTCDPGNLWVKMKSSGCHTESDVVLGGM